MVGAIPTRCLMKTKQDLKRENERLKAQVENTVEILDMYRTVMYRVARPEVIQIELNKVFKEFLCEKYAGNNNTN